MLGRIHLLIAVLLMTVLLGCGGTGSSGNTDVGGGFVPPPPPPTPTPGPTITLLSPSTTMVGSGPVGMTIYGTGFNPDSQVFIDGALVLSPEYVSQNVMKIFVDQGFESVLGTHQFVVQEGTHPSLPFPFLTYQPPQGPLLMNAIPGFLVGEETDPTFIAVADVDGDGYADVITPAIVANVPAIAILRGKADGSLSLPQYITSVSPSSLAALDVNGDGNVDLVCLTTKDEVVVLLGDGHGNFQKTSVTQTFNGSFVGPAYMADINGDGKPDLIFAQQDASAGVSEILGLINDGKGNFGPPQTLGIGNATNLYLAIADFNQDGKPDIVYPATDPQTGAFVLHMLVNQGGLQFADSPIPGVNAIFGLPTAVDFNLDGIPDLLVETTTTTGPITLYSFQGQGNGSFVPISSTGLAPAGYNPYQFVTADFDHDGFPDLAGVKGELYPSHIVYLFGDGHGNFTPQQVVGPMGFFQLAVGDINGDGLPDVVTPDRFNFVSVALGRGDRNFPSLMAFSPSTVTNAIVGDINGDGWPDIFFPGYGFGGISIPGEVYASQGGTSFQLVAHTDPASIEMEDLTGKGVPDLVGVSYANVEIWPNNLTYSFSSSPLITPILSLQLGPVADMDGDGFPDIVAGGEIFYGNGAYQFTPVATPRNQDLQIVVGDFNGDGKKDLVTGTSTFLNIGNREFIEVNPSNLPLGNGSGAGAADINGDGLDDVVVLSASGALDVYYSRGDGTFYQGTDLYAGQGPIAGFCFGDFNGDGRIDIAAEFLLSQQIVIFFNEGNNQFARTFYGSGAAGGGLRAADLTRNGKLDLVITNEPPDTRPHNVNIMFQK